MQVVFNGSVAYCPQSAWIMNATLRCDYACPGPESRIDVCARDNVLFGSELDEARQGTLVLWPGHMNLNLTC